MQIKKIIKWLLFFMIFLLSWLWVTQFRTMSFGFSIAHSGWLLVPLFMCMYPLSIVALIFIVLTERKLPHKKFVKELIIFVPQMLIIAVLVMLLSEIWASSEEYLFKKKCTENTVNVEQVVWKVRRWPFTNHTMGYHKGVFFAQD